MRGATVGDQVRPQSELISIHAPLAGCDIDDLIPYANNAKFQSTHPSRGATRAIWIPHSWRKYFNPRAPCGARQRQHDALLRQPLISIHAPRAGRDAAPCRASVRSAISIHAPRAGRDEQLSAPENAKNDFNPRAPCGARHGQASPDMFGIKFQSTRPVRGATPTSSKSSKTNSTFQSTRPVRGATVVHHALVPAVFISIHAPRAGRDVRTSRTGMCLGHFNPRAPCGARLALGLGPSLSKNFNPRAPCGARRACSWCAALA